MRDTSVMQRQQDGDVVLGEDWVTPDQSVTREMQVKRARRGLLSLKGSPLTRKIITFKHGAYWWSPSEGAYPLSAALETIKEQGGWIETIPNPNYRPKGLFG